MVVQVRERTIEEIEEKLGSMNTALNKINYLESALKQSGFSFEVKRFLYGKLAELYCERSMFERAGKAMSNKAAVEPMFKDKVNSYLEAAEWYSKAGRIEDAEEMFVRAGRDATASEKMKLKLAKKNIYMMYAGELENQGKKAGASKFYERLIKMDLDETEKKQIKEKLAKTYTSLGLFREARLLDGL